MLRVAWRERIAALARCPHTRERGSLSTARAGRAPLACTQFNGAYKTVVSADAKGLMEYWDADTYEHPSTVAFEFKSDTDLFEFAKVRPAGALHGAAGRVRAGAHAHVPWARRKVHVYAHEQNKTAPSDLAISPDGQVRPRGGRGAGRGGWGRGARPAPDSGGLVHL